MKRTKAVRNLSGYIELCEREGRCVHARTRAEEKMIARFVREGELAAVRPGLYARPKYWEGLKRRQRHMHQVRAIAKKNPEVTFCMHTAAMVHGLSVSYRYLGKVHVIAPRTATSFGDGAVTRHRIKSKGRELVLDVPVTPLDQTVADCLVASTFAEGLIIADSVLHEGLMERVDLARALIDHGRHRKGVETARRVVLCADGLSESGGESKARAMMIERGWMLPELQVWLPDVLDQAREYRVDYLWRVGDRIIIGEFDGRIKAELAEAEGELAERYFNERRRESNMTLMSNCKIVRIYMDDLRNPERFDRKLQLAGVPRRGIEEDAEPLADRIAALVMAAA